MEIITGVERRRRWRLEEKLRIVDEVERPGACFAEVARRHEVSRGLLWSWRRQVRRGTLAAESMPMFMPVRIVADPPPARALIPSPVASPNEPAAAVEAGRIEIALPDGTRIRVGENIGLVALRRVITAVRR